MAHVCMPCMHNMKNVATSRQAEGMLSQEPACAAAHLGLQGKNGIKRKVHVGQGAVAEDPLWGGSSIGVPRSAVPPLQCAHKHFGTSDPCGHIPSITHYIAHLDVLGADRTRGTATGLGYY